MATQRTIGNRTVAGTSVLEGEGRAMGRCMQVDETAVTTAVRPRSETAPPRLALPSSDRLHARNESARTDLTIALGAGGAVSVSDVELCESPTIEVDATPGGDESPIATPTPGSGPESTGAVSPTVTSRTADAEACEDEWESMLPMRITIFKVACPTLTLAFESTKVALSEDGLATVANLFDMLLTMLGVMIPVFVPLEALPWPWRWTVWLFVRDITPRRFFRPRRLQRNIV